MHKQQKAECRLGLLCNPVSKRVACRYRIMLRSTMKDDFRSNPCPCSAYNGKNDPESPYECQDSLVFLCFKYRFDSSGKGLILPLKQSINKVFLCL